MKSLIVSLAMFALLASPGIAEAKKKKKKDIAADYVPGPALSDNKGPLGIDRIMGKDARTVINLLGRPASDVREEGARRLQFSNRDCILDAYFYAPTEGKEPVVTHVAARVPDGRDAERNSCLASFRP